MGCKYNLFDSGQTQPKIGPISEVTRNPMLLPPDHSVLPMSLNKIAFVIKTERGGDYAGLPPASSEDYA